MTDYWAFMVTRMRADYMGAGIYKQVLDGNKLLQLFEKILSAMTTQQTGKTEMFVSTEQSLKELYPGLKYQVLDASQFTYFNRLDFPTSKLYGDTIDESTINQLVSWRPKTQTATGYEPWVQKELEKIPRGAHVVLIHPDVQQKMEQDSDYAKQIVAKIQKYFDDDIRINAAIDPESVKSMSQLVSITKDGEIGFHETVCEAPSSDKKYDDENAKVDSQVNSIKQDSSNKLPHMELRNLFSLQERMQIIPLEYNYNYASGIYNLNRRWKTEKGHII